MTDTALIPVPSPWQELVQALDQEIDLVRSLRDLVANVRQALARIQVSLVLDWVGRQRSLLTRLEEAGAVRREVIARCIPGAADVGAVSFRTLIAVAPEEAAPRLREQSESLRQLRDEVAQHSARNEALVRQVLEFTDEIGRSLASRHDDPSYVATGRRAQLAMAGDLVRQSL